VSRAAAADLILLVHAAFVLFVVGGFAAICLGIARRASFAFNPWFRGAHLAAIGFVALETVLGYACPLTVWEAALRGTRGDEGFLARYVHAWLFWNAPAWVFGVLYVAFALAVAWTWRRHPPRRPGGPSRRA
jgi:hypothetical protein